MYDLIAWEKVQITAFFLFFAVRESDYELKTFARQLRITGFQADIQKVNKFRERWQTVETGNNGTKKGLKHDYSVIV